MVPECRTKATFLPSLQEFPGDLGVGPDDLVNAIDNHQNGFHIPSDDTVANAVRQYLEANGSLNHMFSDAREAAEDADDTDMEVGDGFVVMSPRSVQIKLEALGLNPTNANLTDDDLAALGCDVTSHVMEVIEVSLRLFCSVL